MTSCCLAVQAMLRTAMGVEGARFLRRASYARRGQGQAACRNGFKRHKVTSDGGTVGLFVPLLRRIGPG